MAGAVTGASVATGPVIIPMRMRVSCKVRKPWDVTSFRTSCFLPSVSVTSTKARPSHSLTKSTDKACRRAAEGEWVRGGSQRGDDCQSWATWKL